MKCITALLPFLASSILAIPPPTLVTLVARDSKSQTLYGQCGGSGWSAPSPTACMVGASCRSVNPYYSQCTPTPGAGGSPVSSPRITPASSIYRSSSAAPVTTKNSSSSAPAAPKSSAAIPPPIQSGKVQYAGINIAGCDFGCDINGTCDISKIQCPTSVGPSQMQHFARTDKLNVFRLPVGWQPLVGNTLGAKLDPKFLSTYDGIMQACLKTGASCIIDIHNYARWNGGVVGQGGPPNADFVSLWSQLATKYAGQSKVIFGLVNEPHDLKMDVWAATLQQVVIAIRKAGATKQMILLPGTGYTGAGGWVNSSAPALSTIKDSDGTTDRLVFDIHQYLDTDNSGTHSECVTNHIADNLTPLVNYLRQHKRKAFMTETGGGNTPSCVTNVCAELDFLIKNSDVMLGWLGWGAGAFAPDYILSQTPTGTQDTLLVQKCIAGKF